ncbi:MAG: UDP-N-acetylmuramoyl-tripeptide--D-alanyl-D-alanine ligase [Candidatus Pacebacteria bacterium]|nr:UDP-N-acetylmuramoyl-tripeptide--D-alanyl-D-alanine ligase [Candidatus Paceibacterota bacterium]
MIYLPNWFLPAISLIILIFWLIKEIKSFLFWAYLWQLKNYHIGRFRSHFSTFAGRKLIFNWPAFIKTIVLAATALLLFFVVSIPEANAEWIPYLLLGVPAAFLIYLAEGFYSLISFKKKTAKTPELTPKVLFLLPIIFIPLGVFTAVFAYVFAKNILGFVGYDIITLNIFFVIGIIVFDLLTPLIVSFLVLMFQPVTVFQRNKIIRSAIAKREKFENLLTIGIAGSFGKSSVKEFLKTVLSESFRVAATEANKNSEMGISEYIINKLAPEHEVFICEMGAYNRGGIKLLCDIAKPKIGVLAGIGNQHASTFGSLKNIIKAKFELIDCLPEEGLAVLNWDSQPVKENFNKNINSIKYSVSGETDIWAEEIKIKKQSLSFRAIFKTGESINVSANLIGAQNVINLLPAIAIGKRLGMENEEIANGIKKIRPEQGGITLSKGANGACAVNSSYSSNATGVSAHLEYLKEWGNSEKIFVMPCIIELGKEAKQTHFELGKKIGETCDFLIVTTKDYFREIKKGAVQAGMNKENIFLTEDAQKQYDKIKTLAKQGSVVFIEGRVPEYLIRKLDEKK